jgi:hypothetical protein
LFLNGKMVTDFLRYGVCGGASRHAILQRNLEGRPHATERNPRVIYRQSDGVRRNLQVICR